MTLFKSHDISFVNRDDTYSQLRPGGTLVQPTMLL